MQRRLLLSSIGDGAVVFHSNQYYLLLVVTLVLLLLLSPTRAVLMEGYRPNEWYTRYEAYPDYCSTPEAMYDRQIPPLREWDPLVGETRLIHVTAVIRHGARTPWTSEAKCWDGYWDANSDTSRWDCDLTTVTAPSDPKTVHQQEGDTTTEWLPDDVSFLYEKVYDALNSDDEQALSNELNGTCQKGQMLLQGYEQQIRNGDHLRSAYGYYDYDIGEHDERMRLFPLTMDFGMFGEHKQLDSVPWDSDHLYLRADDDQRTVMSGQVLLRGLFDEEVMEKFFEDGTYPNVTVHTADRIQDVLDANIHICPRLQELQNEALQSDQYQAFNSSDEMEALRWFSRDKLGAEDNTHMLDCLMTTICTDRTLPDAIDDFHLNRQESSMFRQLAKVDIQSYNLIMKYNNSALAKLAMGPLWAEIMENINPWLQQFDDPDETPGPKFALYSGHDTTIMPLLASLDGGLWNDTEWPAYASMMLIEIHELIDGISDRTVYKNDFAFRLLFNGRILTHLVPGCPPNSELCDVAHFKALVDPIATRNPDCDNTIPPEPTEPRNEVMDQAQSLINTTEGIFMFLGLVVVGMMVGALGTHVLLTGRLPWVTHRVLETNEIDEDDEARQVLQSRSSYFDDYNDYGVETNEQASDEENEDGFVDAGGRIDSITTGLQ